MPWQSVPFHSPARFRWPGDFRNIFFHGRSRVQESDTILKKLKVQVQIVTKMQNQKALQADSFLISGQLTRFFSAPHFRDHWVSFFLPRNSKVKKKV